MTFFFFLTFFFSGILKNIEDDVELLDEDGGSSRDSRILEAPRLRTAVIVRDVSVPVVRYARVACSRRSRWRRNTQQMLRQELKKLEIYLYVALQSDVREYRC